MLSSGGGGVPAETPLAGAADRRRSEELSEEEEAEEELERRQAAVEVVGEMQLTAEQLKVRAARAALNTPIAWTLRHMACASHMRRSACAADALTGRCEVLAEERTCRASLLRECGERGLLALGIS